MSKKVKIVLVGMVFLGAALCMGNEAMARLRRNEVRSVHIRDGEVRNQDLGANAVTTDKIAPDTITNADIAPGAAIDAGKIADGPGSGLDADTVDGIEGVQITANQTDIAANQAGIANNATDIAGHNHDGIYERLYNNVITVAPDGNGDYTDPVAAIASITDNAINTPYLLKLMPGVYDIGASTLQMKQYVDIEGCGENVTKITGNAATGIGVISGADNAELRWLTVEHTGGVTYARAIFNSNASPGLTHITAIASGGTYNYGVYNSNASPVMTNVSTTASGGDISYGVYNINSPTPVMTQVSATASGGILATYGVYNSNASPVMTNVSATASGGSASHYGVYNNSSSPVMTNVSATASGGTYTYGVYNNSSSPSMTNVNLTASGGGTANRGILSGVSGTVRLDNCVISGTLQTIRNDAGVTTYVGHSRLEGGGVVANTGTLTCIGAYDGNYAALDVTCQ